MQKIAAYILERRDDLAWPQSRADEVKTIRREIDDWLKSKGRRTSDTSGRYEAEDGSHAVFRIEEAVDGERSWWFVQLDETTDEGRLFRASVSVTSASRTVAVYLTMEIGSAAALINPVHADARCPKLIRTLLKLPGNWYHGESQLFGLRRVSGFEQGEGIAAEVSFAGRTIPVVVVTTEHGRTALPRVEERLAHNLAGLANVVVVDDDASWALTDHLGKSFTCYGGAIRLYWPRFNWREDPFRHPLWTPQGLWAANDDQNATRERLCEKLRGLMMRASALSAKRPADIDDIRNAATRKAYADMKSRANSLADFQVLAESFARDNDELRIKNNALNEALINCQGTIVELESRLENAEVQLRHRDGSIDEELSPDSEPAEQDGEEAKPPFKGEVRFYKKTYSAPTRDIVIRVADCGCNNWESGHAGHKARKGILKFEGQSELSLLQHCASCKGGGMWKVRW